MKAISEHGQRRKKLRPLHWILVVLILSRVRLNREALPRGDNQQTPAEESPISSTSGWGNGSESSEPRVDVNDATIPYDIHQGARFPNGSFGFVANVHIVREQHLSRLGDKDLFSSLDQRSEVCGIPLGQGVEGQGGWMILDRIVVDSPNPVWWDDTDSKAPPVPEDNIKSNGTILCILLTSEAAHEDRLEGIRDTWGWRCDGFFAASNKTVLDSNDPGFGAVDIPHQFEEAYNNLWQKMRTTLAYTHDNFIDDFDYFYFVNDDAPVIIENMRRYLGVLETRGLDNSKMPLLTGEIVGRYTGGGSGHLLNRLALGRIVQDVLPVCRIDAMTYADDRYLGACMTKNNVMAMVDSVDDNGRPRFHGRAADEIWVETRRGVRPPFCYRWEFRKHGPRYQADIISSQSVALHRTKGTLHMKRVHAIIYKSCPLGTPLGDDLANTSDTTNSKMEADAE